MKDSDNYGKHEQGNTVSFGDFQSFLDENYKDHNLNFNDDFL